ncbi:DNA-packaging protein [Methanococcoides methylutens]|uniref:DNA-packaging protein n=1 Tax=Methanococcoides methylutens TaxID=2226 RepID=UPI0006947C14|nr:DNA-packaging protein [Methanococcoides methylutens]
MKFEGSHPGQQELNVEILDDNPDALWQRDNIETHRVAKIPELVRIVVGVDPAVTSKDGDVDTGIVVAGIDRQKHGYVMGDYTCHTTPRKWAAEAIAAFGKHSADRVIGEVNNGGDLVEVNLRAVDQSIPFKAVRASPMENKREQSRYHHTTSNGGFNISAHSLHSRTRCVSGYLGKGSIRTESMLLCGP